MKKNKWALLFLVMVLQIFCVVNVWAGEKKVETPKIYTIKNIQDGQKVTWKKVDGAQYYKVYCKLQGKSWVYKGKATGLSWTNKKVTSGKKYFYTVRAIKDNNISDFERNQGLLYLEAPKSKMSNTSSGIKITWEKVNGATKYRVYRKNKDGSYTGLQTIKNGSQLVFYDKTVNQKNGTIFAYAVRAYNDKNVSAQGNSKEIVRLTSGKIIKANYSGSTAINFSWDKNKYADGYQIYYKLNSKEKIITIKEKTTVSKKLTGLTGKENCYLRVRCYKKLNGKCYYSNWSAEKIVLSPNMASLKKILEKQIVSYPGTISIYMENLKTGERLTINNKSMYAASLIKLYALGAAYEKIQKGTLNEKQVSNTLRQMITISSNDAFNSIVKKIGLNSVNKWCTKMGYFDTNQGHGLSPSYNNFGMSNGSGRNMTSVEDCGKFMASVYKGTCVSKTASKKMLAYLKGQTRVSKIPAGVPRGVVVANKTGETDDYSHDAAIVYTPKGNYVLCVMTYRPGGGWAMPTYIKQISSTVYQYITK